MHCQFTTQLQLPEVAACHAACFPDSLSIKLGSSYIQKSLEWFLAGENRFLLHINEQDKIVGYCGGFLSRGVGDGSTSGMMQFAFKEAIAGMFKKPWLFLNREVLKFWPLIMKNILRKIKIARHNPVKYPVMPHAYNHSRAGLVVIGVLPQQRGKGYFELLVRAFEAECKKRQVDLITLTVKPQNTRAIAAYKKTGWRTGTASEKAVEMFKELFV